jgi:uncharacterized protein (TIGR00303 family)
MTEAMIRVYTQIEKGEYWLTKYQQTRPLFACILGFTETGLIPGISAAGATPEDRKYTALADAEFLANGPVKSPRYSLPPLIAGASPVLISRAVVANLDMPIKIFNAGLPIPPAVSHIDLQGKPANCLSTGRAMDYEIVKHLFDQGLIWGEKLADLVCQQESSSYVILGECVVGGTTTALAILLGLGFAAAGKVNSSHPLCNHAEKLAIARQGLQIAGENLHPLQLVAAVGDPMQIVVAGMAIAISRRTGVMLAGGTQMLAVYALLRAIALVDNLVWHDQNIVVGTTRWVAEDPTGDTVGLAELISDIPLLATQLNFTNSQYSQLQMYEQGYVKEGVGAGACAIAASLFANWGQVELLRAIDELAGQKEILQG